MEVKKEPVDDSRIDVSNSSGSKDLNKTLPEEALISFLFGKQRMLIGDNLSAVLSLKTACELYAGHFGELAIKCGEAYVLYGKAVVKFLGEKALMEPVRSCLRRRWNGALNEASPSVDESSNPSFERIPLSRFPSIVKVVERAEYETIQILYQLMYQRSAWDTQDFEMLSKSILDFSGFNFNKSSEEYHNREEMLQTLPNSVLMKIGSILCLDQVKNVFSSFDQFRSDLINAIMEFLALPKKKTRGPRIIEAQLKVADILFLLGKINREFGNYPKSIDAFRQCLNIQKKHLNPDDEDIAETHIQMGFVLRLSRIYPLAVEYFREAKRIYELILESLKNEPDVDDPDGAYSADDIKNEISDRENGLLDIKEGVCDIERLISNEKKELEESAFFEAGVSEEKYKKIAEEAKEAHDEVSVTNGKHETSGKLWKGEPRRPPRSVYGLFSSEKLTELTQVDPKNRMTEIKKLWEEMTCQEKVKYAERVQELKRKYNIDLKKFFKGLTIAEFQEYEYRSDSGSDDDDDKLSSSSYEIKKLRKPMTCQEKVKYAERVQELKKFFKGLTIAEFQEYEYRSDSGSDDDDDKLSSSSSSEIKKLWKAMTCQEKVKYAERVQELKKFFYVDDDDDKLSSSSSSSSVLEKDEDELNEVLYLQERMKI